MAILFQIFHSVMCNDVSTLPRLHLSAMVCYYGKHYSTFVWHTKLNCWVYFDDATVKEVGILNMEFSSSLASTKFVLNVLDLDKA